MAHYKEFILARSRPFGAFPDISTTYALEELAEGDNADRLTIYISSSLNQDVVIQPVGQVSGQPSAATTETFDIAGSITVASGVPRSVTIRSDVYAHSFYGATLTTGGTAPTAGDITVVARVWERHEAIFPAEALTLLQQLALGQQQINAQMGQNAQLLDANHQMVTQVQDLINQVLTSQHNHGPVGQLMQGGR